MSGDNVTAERVNDDALPSASCLDDEAAVLMDEKDLTTMAYGDVAGDVSLVSKGEPFVQLGPFHIKIIHPFSRFRVLWERTIMVSAIICALIVPLHAGFRINKKPDELFVLLVILDALFWADFILNFFTGRMSPDDELLMDVKSIAKLYCKFPFGGFWVDAISVFPIDYLSLVGQDPFSDEFPQSWACMTYHCLAWFRMLRLPRFFRYLIRIESKLGLSWIQMRLVKNIILLGLFLHIFTCILFAQCALHRFSPNTLIALVQLQHADEWTQYTHTFLSIAALLSTNAYGNYGPNNPLVISELWILIIVMFFGVLGWGATTSTFAAMILAMDPTGQAFIHRLDALNRYMREKSLPRGVRSRVREYFHRKYKLQLFDESAFLEDLPVSIRRDVVAHVTKRVVQNTPVLRCANSGFLNTFLPALRNEWNSARDIVLVQDEPPSSLYLINKGIVSLFRDDALIANCVEGSVFGELSALWGIPQLLSAFTCITCEFFAIERDEFLALLENYPDVKAMFVVQAKHRIADWQMKQHAIDSCKHLLTLEGDQGDTIRSFVSDVQAM